MATLITSKPSTMNFPSSLNRMGTFPIDLSSVWYSYDDAVAYATQTNFKPTYKDQTGLPYVGQILTVVETAEDGTTSVTAYSIQNEAGDLARVGSVTLGDDASIAITTKIDEETNKEVEVLTLYGFADAEEGEFAVVGADGKLDWKKISADEATITNDEGTLALKGIKELTWKEGEGEDAKDVAVYQPKLVKKDGKVTLTWEIPSAVTVDGLDTRLKTAEENISEMSGVVGGHTTKIGEIEEKFDDYYTKEEVDGIVDGLEGAIDAVEKDLADNYYDKKEVDAKITSVLKFQGVKTYKDELPATGQVVGDVWLVIYDGNTPAEGEANTLPVANIEYVWTTENKWEPLGDDIIDLTNYYTKAEVNAELAKKGAVNKVEDGTEDWAVKVTDAEGNVTHAKAKVVNANGETAGLVKGSENVSIADGVITVNEAGHAAEATHATNADNAQNAVDATNAVNAQNADEASHALEADEADHAASADEATHAGSADTATRATDANHADAAAKVDHKLTVIGKEFDGSADVSVTADEVKTAINLGNYYTKGEADNNFMTETETNDAIAAVTDPLAEAIEAIKGDIPEEEGYVLPNLVNVGVRLDAHDEAIEGLGEQVETANGTAKSAEDKAKEAVDTATAANETATQASEDAAKASEDAAKATQTADDAKSKAEAAVSTANAASDVANEAKTKAEEAVGTANTAKGTADNALAKAGANETAIKALQEKDTTIEGLVNTNTTNITNLTNTVTTGLADRYTKSETNAYVAEQIAAIDHLKREVVESLPGTPDANTIYMVPNAEIMENSFSGTTAEGIPADQTNKMYDIFANGLTFTVVYNGVRYNKVKAIQNASVENDGYDSYMATFGDHYLKYEFGSWSFDVQDSTPYSILWPEYPEDNYYVEWMYINNKWERIGTTSADLTNYVTVTGDVSNTKVNGVKLSNAINEAKQTADWNYISNKPSGSFIKTTTVTIPAGSTQAIYDFSAGDGIFTPVQQVLNYKAYMAINDIEMHKQQEVIIDAELNELSSYYTFSIASPQTSEIKINIQYIEL